MEDDFIIKSPLTVIKSLLDKDPTMISRLNEVGSYFMEKLNGDLTKIPCINEISLKDIIPNSLVRYRGMIQDMFDPEFYLGKYSITNGATKENFFRFGCYQDDIKCEHHDEIIDFESSSNVTLERQAYYCVPIPGENKWLKKMFVTNAASHNSLQNISGVKRSYENQDCKTGKENKCRSSDHISCPSKEKQLKLEDDMMESPEDENLGNRDINIDIFEKNNPLPGEDGIASFVKVYSDVAGIKLNDVAEFVCIWSVVPIDTSHTGDSIINDDMVGIPEGNTFCPPSFVPRLHCIFFTKLTIFNPHISLKNSLYENTLKEISTVRNDLMQILTNIFCGDSTVAEYFLIHMIARTYGRCGTMCIGKYSLNISNCDENFAQSIYDVIENVTEKSFYLPLTIENLNKLKYTPRKDYEVDRLVSGILQLSSDTNLVLDETKMQPGKLETEGVNNLKALNNLIQWQNVEYDFKFSVVEMGTNVNILVLSQGKSLLKCDCQIPIVAKGESKDIDLSIEKLYQSVEKFRLYLAIVQSLEYNLSEEVSKALQDDFVEMRKQDSKATNADTFYFLLSTARYMALSYGQNTLSASLWTRTKELDAERRNRNT